MDTKLHISVSPHIRSSNTTQKIMLDVAIALSPAAIAGCMIFGLSALWVILTCVASSILFEFLFNLITKRTQTIGDLSAVVTGLLLALNLPATTPLWQCIIGSAFAIIIVKCIFGGLGCNLVNPAMTARVFMLIAFTNLATPTFPANAVDATSSATPLANLVANTSLPSLWDLLVGNIGGAIGETCKIALIAGGIYLLIRRVITWHIPVITIATVFVFTFLLNGFDFINALYWVISGGLIIGAFFMATDYVTSPSTAKGKVIFAIGVGLITVLIRIYGSYPEGVSFAILMMNILHPYIEKFSRRKLFGGKDYE
ncbi:MAG: RnfABCDGE type electron transport complex subunit D [Ruminococcaceae bacterium]|nr:RnfABCDGE type electron transport complex subunit D [Oscillospiraceae bacterium]